MVEELEVQVVAHIPRGTCLYQHHLFELEHTFRQHKEYHCTCTSNQELALVAEVKVAQGLASAVAMA